jgi:hypothetical protein
MPLEALFFYESTNVLDGRIDVLLELPRLSETAFMNRRHYTHTMEQIERAIAARK